MNISQLALSTVFRKLPLDLIPLLLKNHVVLSVMNDYTEKRYGESFWLGTTQFNDNFRLVCPPTAFDFNPGMWPPFYKTVFLERTPFTEGQDYAKFGINWRLKKLLLCDDEAFL